MRSAFAPSLEQRAEFGLRAGRGRPVRTGFPSPTHQSVFTHMMEERRHIAISIAAFVFDLLANLAERFALPSHLRRSQMPFGMTRDARRVEIRGMMTGPALQAGRTVIVCAADHQRLMRTHPVGLRGPIGGRMTVHAARIFDDPARFPEQRDRAFALISNCCKTRNRTKASGTGSWIRSALDA